MSKYINTDSIESRETKQEIENLRKTVSKLQNSIKKLESSESLLRTIIDNAPFEIWARNKKEIIILENNATAKHFGSILGKNPYTQDISPQVLTIWKSNNKKAFHGEIIDEECEFIFQGQKRNYHQIIFPIIFDQSIEGIAGFNIDITERKQAQKELQNHDKVYRNLVEHLPDGVYKSTHSGKFVEVNPALVKMLGYNSKEELIAIDIKTELYFQPEDRESLVLQEKYEEMGIFRLKKKDGSEIWVEDHGWYTLDENGEILYHEGIMRDITERRKTEKAIFDDRIFLRTLIDNIPDAIYVKDTFGRKLISNKADLEILGLTNEKEVQGKTDMELSYPGNASQTFNDDMSVIQTAQPILNRLEFFNDPKGTKRYFLTSKIPLTNDSGEIIGLVGVGHEITREKHTEQKLIQLSKGIEQSPASIIITDTKGNIEFVNQKFIEVTGYSFAEMKGKNPNILQSGYTSKAEYAKLWETITSGNEYHGEIQNRKRNGDIFWESVLISPIRDEAGKIVNYMAIKEDITNRKKSDLEILKLSVAIDQNPASVVITDTRGIIEYVNKKFLSVSGYFPEELIGKVIRILKHSYTFDETYVEIWNRLFAGKEWRGEHQNVTKKKKKYWESVLISPIKNLEGKITNYIILSEDISERKQMEKDLISAKEKAEESDRLKSAFLANMSHEIRTPLNSILGFSDLLTDPELDSETRIEFASLINSSGNNLLAIINDVLDISRIEAGQVTLSKRAFSANKLISGIRKEYSLKASSKGIELKLAHQASSQEIVVLSDETRIKQVLINFIGNALKFTESGYIEIGVKLIKNNIQFHVKDTGIGIDKEFHDKIFDRFRQVEASSTRKYGGNGLGLAITKNLAELLGGKIGLESEPDKGSTFFFTLPEICVVKLKD